ncbi:MAG: InlB B-repeat-containing protein [Clostridia bacterium]|nr:InlB B-repeat-containing protein [Clostridia bacterium]
MKFRLFCCLMAVITAFAILSGCAATSPSENSADLNAEYSVSFNYNYFTFDPVPSAQTVKYGNKATEPDSPTREGYTFIGWYTDSDLTKKWDFSSDTVTQKTVLYAGWEQSIEGDIVYPTDDKDFSSLLTPGSQEAAYDYKFFFRPEKDGTRQGYIGDTMPYYENGVYYIYYLKDGGDSYNHSVFLVTTRDFVTYEEQQTPVLESSRSGGQDGWIGTGSVVKVKGRYYFFYTGHTNSSSAEYKEKIMVAESDNLTSFEKKAGWEIIPPSDLGQKNDFRDPQAYYDEATDKITLTITAAKNSVARVIKYTLNGNLTNPVYDGVIYSNKVGGFWNLECSDTFKIGNKYYLTYSAQDDTLWYAASDTAYGPYSAAKRAEGKLFYAAKHVDDGENYYMVGWARRSGSVSSAQDVSAWAGNLLVQKIVQKENGDLSLAPLDCFDELFNKRRALLINETFKTVRAASSYTYEDVFNCYERFVIKGTFSFEGTGMFGLAFDYNGRADKYKMIRFNQRANTVELVFNEGSTLITQYETALEPNVEYSFTYVQEGSVGVMYLDDACALTVRLYGVSGKPIKLFAENNTVKFTGLCQYTF